MPIYEYRCEACGHEFETLQKVSEAPLVDCPACQAPQLRKKVTAAAFRLKGGGWYETDFKAKDKKAKGSGEGGSDGGASADSTGDGAKSDGSKSDGSTANSETKSSGDGGGDKKAEPKSTKKDP